MHRKLGASLTLAIIVLILAVTNINSVAEAGPIDLVQKLTGSGSPTATPEAAAALPLGKFAASGRLTETLDSGACAGSVAASGTDCSPATNCAQLQFSGPVTVSPTNIGLGKSNLSACMTFDNTPVSSTLSACFDGLGTGTITSTNGKNSVTLAIGGLLCEADAFPLPTPTSIIFVVTSSYSVNGGTGVFAAGVGSGNISLSALVVNPTTPPFPATGQINITGTLAEE
jgi:hypothetical protein